MKNWKLMLGALIVACVFSATASIAKPKSAGAFKAEDGVAYIQRDNGEVIVIPCDDIIEALVKVKQWHDSTLMLAAQCGSAKDTKCLGEYLTYSSMSQLLEGLEAAYMQMDCREL